MLFLLTVVLSLHVAGGTHEQAVTRIFTDRGACETTEGLVLTAVNSDPDVVGWAMPAECQALGGVPKKV